MHIKYACYPQHSDIDSDLNVFEETSRGLKQFLKTFKSDQIALSVGIFSRLLPDLLYLWLHLRGP